MRKITISLVALMAIFMSTTTKLQAEEIAVPAAINYQGKLTNPSDGQPVTPGVYQLEFRVWSDPTDTAEANLIWGRVFAVHVMTNGVFNILITDDGTEVTAPSAQTNDIRQAFQGENRYLGLTITQGPSGVINSPEISPRQRMVSAPFAFHSQNATDAFHAEHADESVLAQDSEKLGGVPAGDYYDNDTFDALGLHATYKTLLGWSDGGWTSKTDLYDYFGQFCMSSGSPVNPVDGVKFLVMGGKIQADDGIIANGHITPAVGHDSGIVFPDNIGGGTGDAAGLSYSVVENEDCELRLYVNNDPSDKIRIESSGDVEINAAGSIKLTGKIFGSSESHIMNQWYIANGDGMITYYGWHGAIYYYHWQEDGFWVSQGDSGDVHWNFYFENNGADSLVLTMPVGKGDKIYFQGVRGPNHWKIRWKPFGNATLSYTTDPRS